MLLAKAADVEEFEKMLNSKYKSKRTAYLGFDPGDDVSAVFLNRVLQLVEGKLREVHVEPDGRHAKMIIKDLKLEGSSGVERHQQSGEVQSSR